MAFDRVRGNPPQKIVLIDSSMLLSLFEFSLDFDRELTGLIGTHKILIPSSVIRELEQLSHKGDGRKAKMASAALQLSKKYETVETRENDADKALVFLAKKCCGIVATNDKELRKTLKKEMVPVILLRNKKFLCFDE